MAKKTRTAAEHRQVRRTFTVFLGLQFTSDHYDRADVISTVESAVQIAEGDLQKRFPHVSLITKHAASKLGEPLNRQIIQMVRGASAGVFEVSDGNPNVYFELGLAYQSGIRKPVLLFTKKTASELSVASDVYDLFRLEYVTGQADAVMGRMAKHIKEEIERLIDQESRADTWHALRQIWSGVAGAKNVTIVCPELPKSYQPKYARRGSPEFVNLARYGDLDSLAGVLGVLPKLAPDAEVKHITCGEIQQHDRESNLIVIGGPDFNSLAEELLAEGGFPFEYSSDRRRSWFCHVSSKHAFHLEKGPGGRVLKDYGLIARFPNPLDSRNTVVMFGGLQTFGVLGAVRAVAMTQAGKRNAAKISARCGGSCYFAILIPVRVAGGQPSSADVDMKTFHLYPW